MDAQTILEQFNRVQQELEDLGFKRMGFGVNEFVKKPEDALSYLLSIMPRCRGMVARGKLLEAAEKEGFMKGILWALGFKTINQLRKMKRQD